MARRKTTTAAADEGQTPAALADGGPVDDASTLQEAPPTAASTLLVTTTSPAGGPVDPPSMRIRMPDERVSLVFRWILDGHSEADVLAAIAEKWPDADAAPLMVAAVTRFQQAGQFEPGILLGWCFEAYRELYRTSKEAGDAQTALRAVKLLSELANRA